MADNAQPGPVARVLQALLSALMHIYTSIFRSTSQQQEHDQEQQKQAPPQPPQQQQAQNQNSTPSVLTSRQTDTTAATATDTATPVSNTLARGQTIRRVPPDNSADAPESARPAQVLEEEQYHHHHNSGNKEKETEDEMAGRGRGRGNGQQYNNNGGGRGQPYRNHSAHSTHSQTQPPLTTSTPGALNVSSSRPSSSSSSVNRPAQASRPVSSSSVNRTQLPLRPGSTNSANVGTAGNEKAQTVLAVVDADTSRQKITPVVKLPPANGSAGQKSQPGPQASPALINSQVQKENERPGYTNAAAQSQSAPVSLPNIVMGNSAVTPDQKPAPAQIAVPALTESQNGTTDVAKATEKDTTPATLPTPIVVPLPYTMKPIPPKLLGADMPGQILPGLIEPKTPEERAEREYHLKYMRAALDMGQLALDTNETPVGCVLVWRDQIIAKGMNATNITRNGTRHAEFMALSALLSRKEKDDIEAKNATDFDDSVWGDVDPTDGHVFPYGQKLHPAPVVDRAIVNECTLYVTVEPCVMCASLLRQLGVKKVYFGAVNDKFGGTGGVFRIHMNSKPVPMPEDRPYQNGYGPAPIEKAPKSQKGWIPREDDEGDGGNVEPGFPAEGGYLRDEAVSLLRRFYVQENGRAPQPRKKEGRAARLFAMEAEAQALKSSASETSDPATAPQTPVETEPKVLPQTAAITKEESEE